MPVLIDCYNVLHAAKPEVLAGLDVAELCRLLARGPWREERVKVVCDGTPGPAAVTRSADEAVELVYAGPGRSADDLIIALIDRDTAPRRLTVVSSDNEIRRAARRRRARAWTSEEFLHRLAGNLGGGAAGGEAGGPGKPMPGPLDPETTRRWMDAFGLEPPEEE
ncbi:MAG: NYN domain-containing protein [Phycisphaeraceae bacterium]